MAGRNVERSRGIGKISFKKTWKCGSASLTLYFKVLFMSEQNQQVSPLADLQHIKKIMERSSRFISLSGLSGVAAGICALGGAWIAYGWIDSYYHEYNDRGYFTGESFAALKTRMILLAAAVLSVSLVIAYFFTARRAKKNNLPMWNMTTRNLVWNMLIPLIAGGLFVLSMLQLNEWRFIAPAFLIFYGLALVNGSKYTLSDIRYLGYFEILLGLINMQFIGYGLQFWAMGFGVLHIVYGVIMWMKYERSTNN
jgi:hypothetical protein